MENYLKTLKNAVTNPVNTLKVGLGMKPVSSLFATPKPALPPATPNTTISTSSNPSASTPTPSVKSPAAQAYIKSQIPTTPAVKAPQTSSNVPVVPPVTTTPPTTTTDAPTQPTTRDSYISAYKDYISAQTNNEDVKNAKTAYNDYVANLAKSKAGLEGRGLGIPVSIVRGEQEKLLNQTQPEAQRLQNAIGIAQADQTSKVASAKSGVDLLKDLNTMDTETKKTDYEKSKDAITQSNTEKTQALLDKKFEEDKRQFGLNYALDSQKVAIERKKANQTSSETATANATKNTEALGSMNLINSLIENPGVSSISGSIEGGLGLGTLNPSGDAQLARNQYDQIKGILSLENRGKLKGQGAVSDFEGKTLERAASSLGRNLSDEDFVKQLKQVRGAISTSHGLNADVLIVDPVTKKSQVVSSNSQGIAQAIKDGMLIEYK